MESTKSRLGKQERQGKTLAASTTLKLEPDLDEAAAMKVVTYCTSRASRFVQLDEVESIMRSACEKSKEQREQFSMKIARIEELESSAASGQEWTPGLLDSWGIDGEQARKQICIAHNASIAAEREISEALGGMHNQLANELAAERKLREQAEKGWTREVQRADDAESAVGENCKTIAKLTTGLAAALSKIETAIKCLKEYMAGHGFISDIITLLEERKDAP